MKSCFPEDSIIGRYGGDEFVVYLKNLTGEMARAYMETFQRMISQLTLPTGEDVELSASAGGAAFPEQGEDVMSLCKSADMALYRVKQNGKADFKMKVMYMKGSRQGRGLLAFYLTRDPFLLDKCTLRKYLIHVCRINLCNGWCRPGVQCIHIRSYHIAEIA